ncbi:MAG: UvrB/UvrC motif-containing protein, partial [Acidimicrobiia bacterium]
RKRQLEYNEEHGIDPKTIIKKVTDILEMVRLRDSDDTAGVGSGGGARARGRSRRSSALFADLAGVPPDELGRLIQSLQEEMHEAAKELRFEEAARMRDEINELKRELKAVS